MKRWPLADRGICAECQQPMKIEREDIVVVEWEDDKPNRAFLANQVLCDTCGASVIIITNPEPIVVTRGQASGNIMVNLRRIYKEGVTLFHIGRSAVR